MIHLLVICGGISREHEVSLQSALNIYREINPKKYKSTLIAVDKEGNWVGGENLILNANDPRKICINPGNRKITVNNKRIGQRKIDCVFPIIHGTGGEDGVIQGYLSSLGLPFVGSDVLSSSICMDKDVTKTILRQKGFSVAEHITIPYYIEWPRYNEVVDMFGESFFVKPVSLGSSIGVSQCHSKDKYMESMKKAFRYDTHVMIEEKIDGREIEIAVIGNEIIKTSAVAGEIQSEGVYSYNAKYINKTDATLIAPADLYPKTLYRLQTLASEAYRALNCEGLARVDFFLTKDQKIYLNEINTLPGFTSISMFPRLWELSGLAYPDLIDYLIQLAISKFEYHQHRKKTRFTTAHDSSLTL